MKMCGKKEKMFLVGFIFHTWVKEKVLRRLSQGCFKLFKEKFIRKMEIEIQLGYIQKKPMGDVSGEWFVCSTLILNTDFKTLMGNNQLP